MLWWKKPLRVIQTNLQVKDTPGMNPKKIAREMRDLNANVLVTNVGGIYAWYPSKVPYHHINEYLPKDFDLLEELVRECHALDIRVVARFDFSKTDDTTFQHKPRWFVRDPQGQPKVIGKDRFGPWSLLLSTCINAGYRNEELAVPVLAEVMRGYDVDGVFFNAPHYERCYCAACRDKYRALYNAELPENPEEFAPDWTSRCLRDNIGLLRKTVKAERPDAPVILYYNLYRDNLPDRTATADMICTEPQDVLSLGWKGIPQSWKPALAVRMGRTIENYPDPFCIIHSCPGMDWRHTGLPPAEYRFWLSQVPANGGQVWHSITGYPDTITDKRILDCVGEVNAKIKKVEEWMDGAQSAAETVLLWNAKPSAEGLAEGLLAAHIPFDLLDTYQVTAESLQKYKLAILPDGYPLTDELESALRAYAASGGNILCESTDPVLLSKLADLLGVERDAALSEPLVAAYLRIEDAALRQGGFERTELLPHRGIVAYVTPQKAARVLATLVPPFAPPDAVGAPPERASLPTPRTDLPLAVQNGRTLLLPFALSTLIRDYRLDEHCRLLSLCVQALTGAPQIEMEGAPDVQAMLYRKNGELLLHLVNGTGQRPLKSNTTLRQLKFSVRCDSKAAASIAEESTVSFRREGDRLVCELDALEVWDMLRIH